MMDGLAHRLSCKVCVETPGFSAIRVDFGPFSDQNRGFLTGFFRDSTTRSSALSGQVAKESARWRRFAGALLFKRNPRHLDLP